MTTATAPAALDAILAAVTAALPGIQVIDGPPVGDEQDQRVIIGWSRNRPTISIARADDTFWTPGAGPETVAVTETYDIPGAAVSYSGDPDLKPRRDAVQALTAAIAAAVAVNPGLDAMNATASLAVVSLTQEKAGTGVQAVADFTITVAALL